MTPYQKGARLFTPDRVQIIRALHDTGLASMRHLAKVCDVDVKTIRRIVKRESYQDVEEIRDLLAEYAGKTVLDVEVPHGI
jgi:predicted transcriptional regulator